VVTIPLALEQTLSISLDDYEIEKVEREKIFFDSPKRGKPTKKKEL
jgi:hypothetical protein